MANELQRLQELNARLQLVPKGATVDELERNASRFTNEAAKLLHGEGWRRIRKTEGKNVDGLDIDKLVNIHTSRIVDIVFAAGANNAAVVWNDVGTFTDTSRVVEVGVDPPAPKDPPEPIGTEPDPSEEFIEAIQDVVNGGDERNKQLARIATALESIAAVLAAAARRVGLG